MELKTMAVFTQAMSRISKSIGVSSEELEPYLGDPVIEEYWHQLIHTKNELDGVIYAVEQSLDEITYESTH